MSKYCKFLFLLTFFCGCFATVHTQDNKWILGEWKGTGITPGSAYSTVFTRILIINYVQQNHFGGKLIEQVTDDKNTRIEKRISGSIINDVITITPGKTLYVKQPPQGFWADCSNCQISNSRIDISGDSIILSNETRLCGRYCDGITSYYKSLSAFDTITQKKLIHLFGSLPQARNFKPFMPANNKTAAVAEKEKTPATDPDTPQKQLSRKNKTIATYDVHSPEIKIELFDNGEIDGDMVTVYHNKSKIIDRQVLGIKPIVYTITATAKDRVHEFTLVANNLGSIPPNTALMRITAGTKIYELFASTTLKDNVSVIIIYSGE